MTVRGAGSDGRRPAIGRWSLRVGATMILIVLFTLLGLTLPRWSGAPDMAVPDRPSVRIERDRWGVPTVHGTTDADVAFGVALAHAEDDFRSIQETLLATRSRLGAVKGVEGVACPP